MLEHIRFFRFPDLTTEQAGFRILQHARGVGRNAFAGTARPFHIEFVELAVVDFRRCHVNFPHPVVQPLQLEGILPGPLVEIADQVNSGGVGSPFAEAPAIGRLMKAENMVGVGKVGQFATGR